MTVSDKQEYLNSPGHKSGIKFSLYSVYFRYPDAYLLMSDAYF